MWAGPDAVAGTVLSELPRSAAFKDLCQRLFELGILCKSHRPVIVI